MLYTGRGENKVNMVMPAYTAFVVGKARKAIFSSETVH